MNTVASLPAKLLLDDLDLIWNSVSDNKETNEAYQRLRAALATPAPSADVGDALESALRYVQHTSGGKQPLLEQKLQAALATSEQPDEARCAECDARLELVRPGKHQHPTCGQTEQPGSAVQGEAVAWLAADGTGRVIGAKAKAAGERAKATGSATAIYSIPLYTTPPTPSAPIIPPRPPVPDDVDEALSVVNDAANEARHAGNYAKENALVRARVVLYRAAAASPSAPGGANVVVDGAALIAIERRRQIGAEDWTPGRDDEHDKGELAMAAACYATPPPERVMIGGQGAEWPVGWPWHEAYWEPGDRIRELVKAGELIAAEIDRLQRATGASE